MIQAAENLFAAMAFEQTVRPIVEDYQRKILAERIWRCAPEYLERAKRRACDEPVVSHVTDIKLAWTMLKADFALYIERCNEERIAAGLAVETEAHCPLLVAEDATRKAKYALCDAMACVTKIPADAAVTLKQADYNRMVDLSLRLLAPFVKNPLPPVAC
jgi:hypothetical protein